MKPLQLNCRRTDQFSDTSCHLCDNTLNDVTTIDAVMLFHVFGETTQRDCFLLHCLRIILAIGNRTKILIHSQIDAKLWIFYCHLLIFLIVIKL